MRKVLVTDQKSTESSSVRDFINLRTAIVILALFAFLLAENMPPVHATSDDGYEVEVAIWWENYANWPEYELPYSDEEARSFSDYLVAQAYWTEILDLGNANSKEWHWTKSSEGGEDTYWIETADIAMFCGHGSDNPHVFLTDNSFYQDTTTVAPSECAWGDGDLEWIILTACRGLKYELQTNWNNVFVGMHGICGYDLEGYQHTSIRLGSKFAEYLTNQRCIGYSWRDATKWFYGQIGETTSAAIYSAVINRPGYGSFNYYYETVQSLWPDYGDSGITLTSRSYKRWTCP